MFRVLAIAGFALAAQCLLAQNFTTERFDVQITVQPDGTLNVVEQLDVNFIRPQRGLIRRLPMVIRRDEKTGRRVTFDLIGVKANFGQGDVTEVAQSRPNGGDWVIRVGSPRISRTGPVHYAIQYQVSGACTPIAKSATSDAHTELLWNILPTAWSTDIEQSKFSVQFPTPDLGELKARVLLGEKKSRRGIELKPGTTIGRTDLLSGTLTTSSLMVRLRQRLPRGQGMTVVLALPGSTVIAPPPTIVQVAEKQDLKWNWIFFAAPFLLLIPLLVWRRSQRHEVGPLVVQFDPPEGFGATECGMIEDRRLDPRDFVGGIISLAQKGAAKIRPTTVGKASFDVILGSLTAAKGLTEFEERLFRVLEPYGPDISAETLRGTFGADFRDLANGLEVNLINDGVFVSPRAGSSLFGCFFAFGMVAIAVALAKFFGPAGMLGSILTGMIGIAILAKQDPWTAKGARIRQHIQGMKEFIQRANRDELMRMSETMPLQALYERLLPFAIAFGLVKNWSQAFDGLDLMAPDWFDRGYDVVDPWTLYAFSSMIGNDHEWNDTFNSAGSNWNGAVSSFDSGSFFSSGDSGFGGGFDSSSGGFDGGAGSGDGGGGGGGDSW